MPFQGRELVFPGNVGAVTTRTSRRCAPPLKPAKTPSEPTRGRGLGDGGKDSSNLFHGEGINQVEATVTRSRLQNMAAPLLGNKTQKRCALAVTNVGVGASGEKEADERPLILPFHQPIERDFVKRLVEKKMQGGVPIRVLVVDRHSSIEKCPGNSPSDGIIKTVGFGERKEPELSARRALVVQATFALAAFREESRHESGPPARVWGFRVRAAT